MGLIDNAHDEDVKYAYDPDLAPGVEQITYKPAGGSNRTIYAQVYREGVQPVADGVVAAVMSIRVRNDSTYGVATTEVNVAGDRVSVAYRKGATARDYPIGQITFADDQELEFRLHGRSD